MPNFLTFKDNDGNSMTLAIDHLVGIIEPSLLSKAPIVFNIVWASTPNHIPFAHVTNEELKKIKEQLHSFGHNIKVV